VKYGAAKPGRMLLVVAELDSGKGSNRRLVPPQRGGLGLFFDGSLCLTWGGYPETLATCRAPCVWNIPWLDKLTSPAK
jgi:hypothetical protein